MTKSSAVNAKIFPKEINFTKLKAALCEAAFKNAVLIYL